jgi:RNA 2',3'-cyclic 3'-phosphodiesterase
MEKLRCFIAIDPDEPVILHMQTLRKNIEARCGSSSIRWIEPEQTHLTLRFLGNVAADVIPHLQDALTEACSGISAFSLTTGEIGAFPSVKRPKVIWLGFRGDIDALLSLQQNIEQNVGKFGEEQEDRLFTPHLTLGRVRENHEQRSVGNVLRTCDVLAGLSWCVREVRLIHSSLGSKGALHQPLQSVPLAS